MSAPHLRMPLTESRARDRMYTFTILTADPDYYAAMPRFRRQARRTLYRCAPYAQEAAQELARALEEEEP